MTKPLKVEINVAAKCPHCLSVLYYEDGVYACLSDRTEGCLRDAWKAPTVKLEPCDRPEDFPSP